MEKTLNIENLKKSLIAQIKDFTACEIFELNNTYCISANYHDDMIYENSDEEINEIFHGKSPIEIMRLTAYGDYNYSHDYFRFDGYGNIQSLSTLDSTDLPDFSFNVVDYMIENPDEFSHIFEDLEELIEIANQNEEA
jgi:hypothetical protein